MRLCTVQVGPPSPKDPALHSRTGATPDWIKAVTRDADGKPSGGSKAPHRARSGDLDPRGRASRGSKSTGASERSGKQRHRKRDGGGKDDRTAEDEAAVVAMAHRSAADIQAAIANADAMAAAYGAGKAPIAEAVAHQEEVAEAGKAEDAKLLVARLRRCGVVQCCQWCSLFWRRAAVVG